MLKPKIISYRNKTEIIIIQYSGKLYELCNYFLFRRFPLLQYDKFAYGISCISVKLLKLYCNYLVLARIQSGSFNIKIKCCHKSINPSEFLIIVSISKMLQPPTFKLSPSSLNLMKECPNT